MRFKPGRLQPLDGSDSSPAAAGLAIFKSGSRRLRRAGTWLAVSPHSRTRASACARAPSACAGGSDGDGGGGPAATGGFHPLGRKPALVGNPYWNPTDVRAASRSSPASPMFSRGRQPVSNATLWRNGAAGVQCGPSSPAFPARWGQRVATRLGASPKNLRGASAV